MGHREKGDLCYQLEAAHWLKSLVMDRDDVMLELSLKTLYKKAGFEVFFFCSCRQVRAS